MVTLWDTTGTEVVEALAAERRKAGALAFGLAMTLVVVADQKTVNEAEEAATAAAAAHPCRILMVVRRHIDAPDPRLDAEVLIGGRLGPGEAVVMRMYGRLGLHAESVTLPLLAPDAPVLTWWHCEPPERIAYDPLGVFADRRVTDVTLHTPDPMAALVQRAEDYAPGDTDLAWTRTTGWRSLIAAAFDSLGSKPHSAVVHGPETPSAGLLVGWLRSKLGIEVDLEANETDLTQVDFELDDGQLSIKRKDDRSALICRPGQNDRLMPLPSRELGDLLAEEVRRLDVDEVYAEALEAWTGVTGLAKHSPFRQHVWRDPAEHEAHEREAETAGANQS